MKEKTGLLNVSILALVVWIGGLGLAPFAMGTESITNINLSPPSPAALLPDEYVNITFDYATTEPGGVRIFAEPFTNGSRTSQAATQPSPLYGAGKGSGTGFFKIASGDVVVDQIQFQMTNSDQSVLLLEFFVPVEYHYGNFVTNIDLSLASNPYPADGATLVGPALTLSWTAGFGAKLHYVYFGETFDEVDNAAGGLPLTATTYSLGTLKMAKTYYWRVDEFDGTAMYKGDIWSFTISSIDRRLEIIVGPSVQEVTQDSALIFWETNEDSNSVVKYSKIARLFEFENEGWELGRTHHMTLTGLDPSTTYHFIVQSTDLSGNTIESKDIIFETLSLPDDRDPTVSIIDPGIIEGIVMIPVQADDNIGIERVEFLIDDRLVFTDYSTPYEFSMDTCDYENGDYMLETKAHDLSGKVAHDNFMINVVNVKDFTAPVVAIDVPIQGAVISGTITVSANLNDDTALADAVFYVDGVKNCVEMFPPDTNETSVQFTWDSTTVPNGTHRLGVKAWDINGKSGFDTVDVTVNNLFVGTIEPQLVITGNEVDRFGNSVTIELTVKNVGFAPATNVFIRYFLRCFQPISHGTKSAVPATYEADFQGSSWTSSMYAVCKITDDTAIPTNGIDIPAGKSHTYSFDAVPVLFFPMSPDPSFGELIRIWYESKNGNKHFGEFNNKVLLTKTNEPIKTAYNNALKQADYLIMTNPYRLFLNYNSTGVQNLLSEMAQLAAYKEGALGYAYTQSELKIQKLIKPNGIWAKTMHPNFSKPLKGYLLVVGETEIVPAWSPVAAIEESDHPYSDTTGNGVPNLIVGRIIGDSAVDLIKPIQASIGVFEGTTGYAFDCTKALMISGPGGGVGSFVKSANDVGTTLKGQAFSKVEYLHMMDYFPVPLKSFSLDYQKQDGFTVGDVFGGSGDEIVIGDASANKIAIYSPMGTSIYEFSHVFDDGDALATGDVMGYGKDQIVQADKSHDHINIMQIQGSTGSVSATIVHSFDASFDEGDSLAVGDVTGDAKEEVVISDISFDRVFIHIGTPTPWTSFERELDKGDLFGVGDVLGDGKDDIVIADQSANEIFVFNVNGPPAVNSLKFGYTHVKDGGKPKKVKWLVAIGDGSTLAVGRMNGLIKDEILIGAGEYSEHIRSYWWKLEDDKMREGRGIPFDFDKFDGLAVGSNNEVFVADRDGIIRAFDAVNACARAHNVLPGLTQNVDVIYWHGHGNAGSWPGACIYSNTAKTMDFNKHNPLIVAASCSTGNYERGAIAESFLAAGAAIYIGSTEDSNWTCREFAQEFFKNWAANESIGEVFTALEKAKWNMGGPSSGLWKGCVMMNNLYGDPKFGKVASDDQTLVLPELPELLTPLHIEIPEYVVTTIDGLDYVEIPGGHVWYEAGEPWIPFYSTSINCPTGYEVQDVILAGKSEVVSDTDLNIPMSPVIIAPSTYTPVPYYGTLEDWFPEQEYRWETMENPDGTSTLVITMYPFYYNPLTTDVRFYKNYSFDINYIVSPVAITNLTTDNDEYEQGDTVTVNMGLHNSEKPEDVIVDVVINQYSSGENVDCLLLRTLKEFVGPASYSPRWDSNDCEPGYYSVEVTLKDTVGNVLDRKAEMFRLGICSGEITEVTAIPEHAQVGDDVAINMTFENTGTVNITGSARIKILNPAGDMIDEFTHDINDLLPSESVTFDDIWNVSEDGLCTILGYVLYDSKATEPVIVEINNRIAGNLEGDINSGFNVNFENFINLSQLWLKEECGV